jgi:hypothetical protein
VSRSTTPRAIACISTRRAGSAPTSSNLTQRNSDTIIVWKKNLKIFSIVLEQSAWASS